MENESLKSAQQSSPISFSTHIYRLDYLKMFYLEIPADTVEQLGGLKCGRLLCTVNNKITFQCGLMALGAGSAYISINSKRMRELGLKLGDGVSVSLNKDDSKYGTALPEELAELLQQDATGKARFDMLKPSMQRYILQYVAGVKSSQLRIERAILIIENLKRSRPDKVIFRELLGKK